MCVLCGWLVIFVLKSHRDILKGSCRMIILVLFSCSKSSALSEMVVVK